VSGFGGSKVGGLREGCEARLDYVQHGRSVTVDLNIVDQH